jgi:large subunit ribosomal protein L31
MARSNLSLAGMTERGSAFTLSKNKMKEKIHPKFFNDAQVVCSCGNTFTIGSTKKQLRVELCSKCHPFFTGERKMIDTAGRVERFKQRYKLPR